jgi:hypothetical protein
MRYPCICLCLICVAVCVFAETHLPVTQSNWLTHQAIKEIRLIYQKIESSIKKQHYQRKEKKQHYAVSYAPTRKIIYIDTHNIVRKFIVEAGSEDSSLVYNYYYNDQGILRFVFITGGAINGSVMEHRIYFDVMGKRIWEIQKYVKGPGYTFPQVWPSQQIYTNPLDEFNRNSHR